MDVPKVSKAITSCGDALEKYVKLPNMDTEYVDEVSTILISASNWCLSVEELYSKMEIHSITKTKGDTSEVGIFTDNSTRTLHILSPPGRGSCHHGMGKSGSTS